MPTGARGAKPGKITPLTPRTIDPKFPGGKPIHRQSNRMQFSYLEKQRASGFWENTHFFAALWVPHNFLQTMSMRA
jgi:hypothetical protein